MQPDRDVHHPSEPPARPSLATRARPSALAERPRPGIIDVSYWLWIGACLVGVITAAATLRYFGELQATVLPVVEQQFPNETPATREQVATATVATLIGAGVALMLAQMILAIAMRSGRGWTRFALVGLTLCGALYTVAVAGAVPITTNTGILTTIALMLIATVPMFLPPARAWFEHHRLRRS
ncbi:MAG: hypothetical protein M3186_06145 [Actinomycetota bacterium]|nr:hypothetical protein [Actinomycetota bacterium]